MTQFCYHDLNGRLPTKKDYSILGDDIVLVGETFSALYKDTMSRLGVEISDQKTHESKDLFEFAKRWIRNGEDVSPYPIHGLIGAFKHYVLADFLLEQVGRGYPLPPLKGPGSIDSLLSTLLGKWKSRLITKVTREVNSFILLSRLLTD